MYVDQITLLNIRSFPLTTLKLSKGINIIVGPNNSGKSTILKSLQPLQQGLTGFTGEDVRKTKSFGTVYIRLADLDIKDKQLLQPLNDSITINKWQDIFFNYWADTSMGKIGEYMQSANGGLTVKSMEDKILFTRLNGDTTNDSDFARFPGFPSMEIKGNFIFPFLSKRKTAYYNHQPGIGNAYTITDQFSNLPARIQNLTNTTHQFHKEYNELCESILGFTPGKVPGPQTSEDKLGIFVGQESVYLESMGEGVANILGLLAIMLTQDNKLFLIEELENDIHPEALKKMLNIILEKAKDNQFIISTHSNIVLKYLASLPETKIFYCNCSQLKSSDQNKIYIPTTLVEEIGNSPQERLQILTKLGYDLFDFDFYASYLILEESSAESIINSFLIPVFAQGLDNEIKTISAGGADGLPARFDDFLRLFVYVHTSPIYYKKAWVLADGDEVGRKNISKLKEKFNLWPSDHFRNLSKVNFEEYYPERFRQKWEDIQKRYQISKDKEEKMKSKKDLTNNVLDWISDNSVLAKKEFEISAKEVINILLEIEFSIKNKMI